MTAPGSRPGAGYIGRFAPSPTGPLHAGSLVAALASWLDARAHGGQWLVRIEDTDTTRCRPDLAPVILQQLAACGLHSDMPPVYQSQRRDAYQQVLDQLVQQGLAYPCACSRQDIEMALRQAGHPKSRHSELIYPGSCRNGLQNRPTRAWRFRTNNIDNNRHLAPIHQASSAIFSVAKEATDAWTTWTDRALGEQQQNVEQTVGDFILKRADGCFAYQLAVVADDAWQGITDIVRGQDLADNTARQILLQRALGVPTPRYLHTPLVLGPNGEKLSKQNGAQALDTSAPLQALNQAAYTLGLTTQSASSSQALGRWVTEWKSLHVRT